jgi:transcriptional regulator with PAS, ATPase and Fis domain
LQAKLLRVLEEREIERVGGHKSIPVDVRIIATTNRDLLAEAKRGRFREDLYYRLNVIPVSLPPLRERLPDIPGIIQHYLAVFGKDLGAKPKVTEDGERLLLSYRWPGNVRELVNIVERLVVLGGDAAIDADAVRRCLPELARQEPAAAPAPTVTGLQTLEAVERAHIHAVLERCHGNKQAAADTLGISRRSLHDRLGRWEDGDSE